VPHCDPEVLSLRALGEQAGTAADEEHLRSCPTCQAELDELRAVVNTGRSVTADDQPVAPPDRVWDRISEELGLSADGGEHPPLTALPPPQTEGPQPQPVPGSWMRRRTAVLLAAAAAILGLAVGSGLALLLGDDQRPPGTGQVIAQASLQPLPAKQARGEATVSGSRATRALQVRVTGLPAESGFYEVWLLNREANKLISVGVLDGERGTFPLPPAVNLSEYPVVDVSLEPFDGDPAHSKNSFVRGTLTV
jgi:Anti-sigma-K factor rskA